MKFTSILKWALSIGLVTVIVAGGAGVHYWSQRHDLIESQLLERFEEIAPELNLTLGRTQLDGLHQLILRNVELSDRETDQPVLRAQLITISVDAQALLDHQQLVIRNVQVDGAEILVVRQESGRWNWQDFTWNPPKNSSTPPPQVDIRQLRVQLHLKHGADIPSARLVLTSPRIQAVPASAHKIDLDGSVELPGTGSVVLRGSFDLANGAWKVDGKLRDLTANKQLLDLAQKSSPDVRKELDRLNTAVRRVLPPIRSASTDLDSALIIGSDVSKAPRFQGQLDVDFDVSQKPGQLVPQFRLLVDVRDGHVSVPGVPIQLSEVNAEFFADNQNVVLKVHQSRYGDAELAGRFEMLNGPNAAPPEGSVQLKNFPIDRSLRSVCPIKIQELFDKFEPDLRLTGGGRIVRQSDGKWALRDVQATVNEGQLNHYKFQYPLTDIRAELRQRPMQETNGDVIIDVIKASGMGRETPFTAFGWWRNPGPGTESDFTVTVENFPLDSAFRQALETKPRKVIESLDLNGIATATVNFYRPPGIDRKTHMKLGAHVSRAGLNFNAFPYEIDQLQGDVTFDSESLHWSFSNLSGQHGTAQIRGDGEFSGRPTPGILNLNVRANRIALDSDLYNALSDSHRVVWTLMDPEGLCDLTTEIRWTAVPGQKAIVRFPEDAPVRLYDARIRPKPFPYEMDVQEAFLSFDPNDPRHAGVQHCRIHSFKASHRDAPITGSGYAQVDGDGLWCVHLQDLTARELPPDDDLRAALPDSWTDILTQLHQRGRVSLNDSELEFKGIADSAATVTAAWNMNMQLHGCTFSAGLDITNVDGHITARGHLDPDYVLHNVGEINLKSAEVLEMPLTEIQGPYSIDESRFVLGDANVLETRELTGENRNKERVTANAYNGKLYLDAIVDMRPGRGYILFTELKNAQLQAFARQNLKNAGQLSGRVSAWAALQGQGDSPRDLNGRGQLEINPAALYEVPVVVELLSALSKLNFVVRNRTAFNYAKLSFGVSNERFNFNQIDLIGESLALRGRGSATFRGDLNLDFYSRPARSSQRSIPIIGPLLTAPTQWARVTVHGTTSNPRTRYEPTAQLDESMRQFLNAFTPQPGYSTGLNVPNILPFVGTPMGFGLPQGRR